MFIATNKLQRQIYSSTGVRNPYGDRRNCFILSSPLLNVISTFGFHRGFVARFIAHIRPKIRMSIINFTKEIKSTSTHNMKVKNKG